MAKEQKIPGRDHPITIQPTKGKVVVRLSGDVVADSDASLTLREASYAPVQYLPLADVDASVLHRSETQSYCPYKGDASYYDVATATGEAKDAIWTYEQPYPAVSEIAGHVAFYTDRVELSVEED